VSPTLAIRKQAKEIIGDADFREIYVNASYQECEKRDVKGLYKKARNGEIKNFTGLDAPFEAPENAFLEIKTADMSIEESVKNLVEAILSDIKA
jgi:adenylylsulfate kinase